MSDTDTETEAFVDDSTPEEITEAKNLGWKSPNEWKGDPPKNGFVKASDYIERGRSVLPIVKSQNARLERELTEARQELADFKELQNKTFQNLQRMSTSALKRQREQLQEKFDTAIDAATEVGDKTAVQKLRKDEREALKEFDEETQDKAPTEKDKLKEDAKPSEMPKAVKDWVAENPWFESDEEMKALAITHHGKLLREKKGLTLEENLAEVRKYVQRRFPEQFAEADENDNEKSDEDERPVRRGSPVEGGSRQGGGSSRSAWSKIPDEAKKQADRFIKEDGLFLEKGEDAAKDLQKARERYAAQYLENE